MKRKIFYLLIILLGLFIIINSFYGWTYLKVKGETYVLCSGAKAIEGDLGERLGVVKFKFPKLLKPLFSNTSNGVPIGTEVYKTSGGVAIKYNDEFLVFTSTNAENWGNGIKVKLEK